MSKAAETDRKGKRLAVSTVNLPDWPVGEERVVDMDDEDVAAYFEERNGMAPILVLVYDDARQITNAELESTDAFEPDGDGS